MIHRPCPSSGPSDCANRFEVEKSLNFLPQLLQKSDFTSLYGLINSFYIFFIDFSFLSFFSLNWVRKSESKIMKIVKVVQEIQFHNF